MTRTFHRITSLILILVALSLNGCKTGDTSLDKLVSSVSDATSGQPSDPLTKRKTDSLCKKFKPFLVGFFSVKFKSGEISEEIQKRKVSPESCMKMAGLTPPKPLSAHSAQSLCKKFQPFSTSQFSVSFKSNDIAAAVKQKGLSPEACMKMAGLSPPKPLSAYSGQSLCKKFWPFSTSQFSVSFKSNDIAAAVKQKGLSPVFLHMILNLSVTFLILTL